MISYENALDLVLNQSQNFGDEEISIYMSLNRVLSEPLIADRNYPPFNRAAMDGYALRFDDLRAGIKTFRVMETIFPAQVPSQRVGVAECYKIMTGAAVPEYVDTVIRIEDSNAVNDMVSFESNSPLKGQNISRRGEDVRVGTLLIESPTRITAPVIAACAVIGKLFVKVRRRPSVAILTTGNEVIDPGLPVSDIQIRNSNQAQLMALLQSMQIQDMQFAHANDDVDTLKGRLSSLWSSEIILTCGAVSTGDADYMPRVLEDLGVSELLHKVAIKPGKPIWIGRRNNGRLVFSLPGNPLSCLTGFLLFVRPFIEACYGLKPTAPMQFALQHSLKKASSLDEFFPAKLVPGTNRVERLSFNGSGDIRGAIQADGLARHPADILCLEEGHPVSFYPL